jgi:beta-lactamase superfamily II metal-dependent hydrolase
MSPPSLPCSARLPRLSGALLAATLACLFAPLGATPPEFPTFRREQRIEYEPNPEKLLRIWMVYIDQGDSLVIQLPSKYKMGGKTIDVLVDGGPNKINASLVAFIDALYQEPPSIEYAVITHHDLDHVAGLTDLLKDSQISFGTIYHNGLASYRAGVRGFPANGRPTGRSVVSFEKEKITRGMAYLQADDLTLQDSYLIRDLASLTQRYETGEFGTVYVDLAKATVEANRSDRLAAFDRAYVGAPFINEAQAAAGSPLTGLTSEVIWPRTKLESYGKGDIAESADWGETINGNSVTFRLTYGEFSMLFTGDQNELSEESLLEKLKAEGQMDKLSCDVLKVPHHGSSHGIEAFFKAVSPVVSVASMGDKGFHSKYTGGARPWKHPSTDVIKWLGGSHRFYSTFVHEKPFEYDEITTADKRKDLIEITHILIETDGEWFRVVEVPTGQSSYEQIPSVAETRLSNGTRWIKAKP